MASPQPPAPFGAGAVSQTTARLMNQHLEDELTERGSQRDGGDIDDSATPVSADEIEEETRHKEITALARTFSQRSQQSRRDPVARAEPRHEDLDVNTFLYPEQDPELNPNDLDHFNSRKWTKNLLQMTACDPDRYPRRTAGVSFRNLNVFGYGTAADYQTNFGNAWLKMMSWVQGQLGLREKKRIDILRNFEGIVHEGEMLVVLGRPGRYVLRLVDRILQYLVLTKFIVDAPLSCVPSRERLTAYFSLKAPISNMRVSPGITCMDASVVK